MKFLTFQADYADEFDVHGYAMMTDKAYEEFKESLTKVIYPNEVYFGTNEFIEFSSLEDIENSLTVKDIPFQYHCIMLDLFDLEFDEEYGYIEWGTFNITYLGEN